ncbi:MAG: efflux RND transporter periplasmic adaptor subunit, partial [Candidatus Zixiibacteriota bacterium]
YGVNAIFTHSSDIPVFDVRKGEFLIAQKVSGEIDAARAYVISAPRIRNLQITWLAKEGSRVKKGDPVVKFDATQQEADLADNQSDLKIKEQNLERARQEFTIQEKQLNLELQKAQRNYDEKKHEAPKLAEEAKLELELAQLNIQAKLDQIKSDVTKAELEVQRSSDKVETAQRELAQMTVMAPIPGMVVYLEIWKGSTMSKVQEGDAPWSGQGIVNLPDLSEMIVKATVSEVDASRVDSGLATLITVDAIPGQTFQGIVTKKSTLARRKDPSSKINVFDVEIAIQNESDLLKPGISASARIVIDRVPDVISVPLEAIFEKEGETVVYLENKKQRKVEVGRRNDMSIEIISGLEGGETICLIDPTLDESELPGEKATEPEINKGRQPRPQRPQGQRPGSGG